MTLSVYMKLSQWKLSRLFARPVLAFSPACGNSFNCYMSTGQEPVVRENLVPPYHSNELEKTFRGLLKEKWAALGKLECIAKEEDDLRCLLTDQLMFDNIEHEKEKSLTSLGKDQHVHFQQKMSITQKVKSLHEEEEELVNKLEKICSESEELRIELVKKRMKSFFDLANKNACGGKEDEIMPKFLCMREATLYFDLIDYLFKNCKSVKYNDLLEEVLVTFGDDLMEKFPLLDERLMRRGVHSYLLSLELLHQLEISWKFGLWLLSSNIEVNQNDNIQISLIWKTFCADMNLSEDCLDICEVTDKLQIYKRYKEASEGGDENELRRRYEEEMTRDFEAQKENIVRVKNDIVDYTYDDVYHAWREGCRLDVYGDPKTEVLKVKEYLASARKPK